MLKRLKSLFGSVPFLQPGSTGERGEGLAAKFLKARKFKIVAVNWQNPDDLREEIDLICDDHGVLVFVEVKTRAADALVPGFNAVNTRKKKVLKRGATAYLRQLHPAPDTFRFDIVEVSIDSAGEAEVRHYENVQLFSKGFRP